jgi:hypothetical protein
MKFHKNNQLPTPTPKEHTYTHIIFHVSQNQENWYWSFALSRALTSGVRACSEGVSLSYSVYLT